jgi:hypothetical protein
VEPPRGIEPRTCSLRAKAVTATIWTNPLVAAPLLSIHVQECPPRNYPDCHSVRHSHTAVEGTANQDRRAHEMRRSAQNRRGGYPVASASLPRSGLRLRRRRDGIPALLVTHHYPGSVLEPSRSEVRRRHGLMSDLIVLFGVNVDRPCVQYLGVSLRAADLRHAPVQINPCGLVSLLPLPGMRSMWRLRSSGNGGRSSCGCSVLAEAVMLGGWVRVVVMAKRASAVPGGPAAARMVRTPGSVLSHRIGSALSCC